jgi:glutathione S-transferase
MRLFHLPGSRSVRVLWTLEECGAHYDLTTLSSWEERKSAEYLARHPLGRVPAMEDEDGPLFESVALCLQVADLHPDSGLIGPLGSHDRGLVYQWALFAATELEPPVVDVWFKESDPARGEAAVDPARAAAQVIEDALAGAQYLVGGSFSLADVVCGDVLAWARDLELLEGLPNIEAYLERLEARPARVHANAA